jgi:hypothetical protein
MSFYFKECKQSDIGDLIQRYVSTLSSPIDSFLEEHILNSVFYTIVTTLKLQVIMPYIVIST